MAHAFHRKRSAKKFQLPLRLERNMRHGSGNYHGLPADEGYRSRALSFNYPATPRGYQAPDAAPRVTWPAELPGACQLELVNNERRRGHQIDLRLALLYLRLSRHYLTG